MYIKSMVLEGFKSYGKRIEINDFDKEFNAVTGFNGSGKSNILDAICFVLGITNLSQVRATSLQDLVYKSGQAGIQKATVTVIFDNHDLESSPIGYEHHKELVITRQIIIGGKNKYMINGSNVPNKRVQDLFCSVQLNVNNPHFLIMQGRITKVLNMKPLEILSMIEEASGTRMYETKKQISLKTIEKKENKLKEINNVLEQEIAPKLKKLKEERFHYMEFQRVQRELDHYNRLNIAWEYVQTIRSNDEAEEQAQHTKNQINEKMKRISIGSKEIEEINMKLNEMNKIKNAEFGEQLGKLEDELKDVEKEQFKITAKFNGNKEDIKAAEKTAEQLKTNINDEEEILLVKEKEFEKVESLFKELKENDEKDSVALTAAQERYQKISSGLLQTENGENATLEQQLINAKQYVTQAQTELQQSQMSLDHAKTQLNTKLKDMRNTEDEYRKDSKVLEKKETELKNLEDQLRRINYKDRSEELQAHKHTLKNEIRSLQEKIDLLEQRYPRLRFYYKKPDLHFKEDSVKGLVCTSLKIKNKDAAYALDLAAGGKLYNVIVDTERNGMKLLEHGQLQQRITIIPLNKIDGRLMDSHIIELAEQLVGADKVQPALSLIDFSEEIRPAMTWIFGQIFICKDMETAEKIAFHKKIMKKCVTLEGDMFDPVGTLSGGAASKTESVLLKIEELNVTKDLLKQKQQDLLKIDEDLIINEKAREKYALLKDKYDLIKYEIDMVQQRLQQTMHHKTKEEVELLKTNIDNLMKHIDAAKTLERDNLIKTKELECQLKDVVNIRENQLKEAENLLTTLKRKAEKSRAEWQKREEKFKTLELEMKELREIIQAGKQQLVKVEDKLIELNEIGNAFAQELEEINAKVKNSRDRVKERKQIINQQNEEMQKLKAKKENITKQKSEDELEIKTLNHQIISFKEFTSKCTCKLIDLKKQYRWIEEDKQYFEKAGGMYDFKVNDPGEVDKKLKQLRTECKELKRNVNMRAINLLGKEEEQYNDMMKKKKIVENDKKKILETIQYLDRKKKEALQKAWEQVNRDFGSIFSSLLPGTDAKLVPPENQTITEGLEIKIGFSGIWKESLGELSGGQRSLVALSLILAMLLFKPAPLYILDEVDAALDLSHTENIGKMLKRHFKHSQFIVVSLKDGMFNNANVLFTTRFVDGMSTVIRTEKSKPKENKGEKVKLLQAASKGTSIDVTSNNILSNMRGSKRDWVFRVQVSDLEKNECLYVVGNLPELGTWNPNQAIQMFQEYNAQNVSDGKSKSELCDADACAEAGDGICNEIDKGQIFSQKITLPVDADVDYRYFIAVICQSNGTKNSAKTLIIRKWETHTIPRQIKKNLPGNFVNNALPNSEIFGCYNGYCKVERGWLTDETVIQFKLFYNPIKLWKQRLQNRIVHIKMTPVNLIRQHSLELQQFGNDCIDDSLSMDTQDIDQSAFSITEIAVMNDEETRFKYQEQFGRACKEDEFIIFNVAVRYPETIAYLVDYYVYSSRSFPGEPPNHIGFSYILPSTLQSSVGMLTVPITSTRHRPIGQLTIEYLVIKPIPNYPWDMSISYTKHWEQRWSGLDVGHRGLGTSFKYETKNCANLRENTLASLKTASYHGADMVEFDVQLSKDLVPVVYHDFYVSISLKRKKQIEAMDTLEIPVKELTLEQLHLLKDFYYPGDSLGKVLYFVDKSEQGVNQLVYHVAEGREKIARFFDEDLEDHQPFPTLQSVLLELEPHVGFNIEIKWTMQLKDGTFELNHPFDLNMYLDIILKVVLEYGGDRKIVFSSFNPDICVMIRLKQNKYPVVFLTQGVTTKYPTYHDPRCQTIPMAIRHALSSDILGINVHTEDILRDPSQVKLVKDAGLIIFCWGDDNNDTDTIRHLKKLGLHAVIYDKMDVYNSKDVKESIFLVDARESQKALIALAQSSQAGNTQQNPIISDSINMDYNADKEYFVDLNKTRNLLSTSTATSLSSLTNSSTACDNISMIKMPSSWQQHLGKNELGGDFNVCAKSFGNPVKAIDISDIVCGQATALPEAAYGEDESAKDCL